MIPCGPCARPLSCRQGRTSTLNAPAFRPKRAVLNAYLLVSMALVSSCTSGQSDSAAGRRFTLGVIPGAQDFITFVMESQGLFEKYDLHPEKIQMLRPASLHLMIAERRVDVGFAGFTTMAIARSQGKDVIVIHGIFSPVNLVFVPHDSPLRSLADLKGKKLGIFGGPGSATLTFLSVIAKQWYGLDVLESMEVVSAPGPALAHLLDQGEVDAALMGTTESLKFGARRTYRVLVDLSGEYKKHHGRAPAHVTVATNEAFSTAHPDVLEDFLKVYQEAVTYVRSHPDIWADYGKQIDMAGEADVAALREKMAPSLVSEWDATQIELQTEYLKLAQEVLGENVLAAIPEDLIRDDFNP